MADYGKSLIKGLEAAKAAERNRSEIDAVFIELDAEVAKATQNKVSVERRQLEVAMPPLTFRLGPPDTYWALVAYHRQYSAFRELAKWQQHPEGYPCRINAGSTVWTCEDRGALEGALGAVLQLAQVGEAFYQLLRYVPPTGLLGTEVS